MKNSRTAEHYTLQWGKSVDFAGFVKSNPEAAKALAGRVLPWTELYEAIRAEARLRPVSVYDAACGFGDVANQLFADPAPAHLAYLGADIHGNVEQIEARGEFIRHDITEDTGRTFDFVICKEAMHHTPQPHETAKVLAGQVKSGGTLVFSVYARKAPMREAVDDAMRQRIVPMGNDEAWSVSRQFSDLGRDLQAAPGNIVIKADLPFLGIKAGTYSIQSFIYDHFMKCWFNRDFSAEHCDMVNFDWYHPPHAYRYSLDEVKALAVDAGLTVRRTASIQAQHFVEAVRDRP
jgi:SAM-dependent methyltransferase